MNRGSSAHYQGVVLHLLIDFLLTVLYRTHNNHFHLLLQDGSVRVVFSDEHSGDFPKEWLYKRRMTPEGQKERSEAIYFHKTQSWPDPKDVKIQQCTYEEVSCIK